MPKRATSGSFDRTDGIPLVNAVAASTAFPGSAPPITVNRRRYLDGGLRSDTNADLVVDPRALIVIEPLAHMFARERLERVLAAAAADSVVTIGAGSALALFQSMQNSIWRMPNGVTWSD